MHPTNVANGNAHIDVNDMESGTEVYRVDIRMATHVNGKGYTLLAWQPNREDIEAINAGRPIMVQIFDNKGGHRFPEHTCWTTDADGNPNE